MIEEMGLENQYLRTHVKELEDQVGFLYYLYSVFLTCLLDCEIKQCSCGK